MLIKVLSVNLGTSQPIKAKNGVSGIFKVPQSHPVTINTEGILGDVICDRENHGGVDQAVYVYCQSDYNLWHQEFGLAVHSGLFGENLTISGISTADAHIGARLIGDNVSLEVTSPRTPCDTFAARMNDKSFPKRFWASRLTGFYCRVIREGSIKTGELLRLQPYNGTKITISEWISSSPLRNLDQASRSRFLSTPIHYKTRQELSS
jgi:MOSC domain-containing protein YiiM